MFDYLDDFICGITCEEYWDEDYIWDDEDWGDIPDGPVIYAQVVAEPEYDDDCYNYMDDIDLEYWSEW